MGKVNVCSNIQTLTFEGYLRRFYPSVQLGSMTPGLYALCSCGHVFSLVKMETREAAEDALKAAGWKYLYGAGWTCRNCQ